MAKKKSHNLPRRHYRYFYFISLICILVLGVFLWNRKEDNTCANSISCISDLSGKFDPSQKEGIFMGQKVQVPQTLSLDSNSKVVLGDTTSSNKHIYIDLSTQRLYAKEGDRTVYEFLISSGKWGKTPTGDFTIWVKLRATRMVGGNKQIGTYYNLPNVPYVMFFYNKDVPKYKGYSTHGTYWHSNFGHPMSHGCINMKIEEARLLYEWANPPVTGNTTYPDKDNPGTPITIYGTAPQE